MLCSLAVAGAAFAQGTVNWTTVSAGGFTAQTNATLISPLFGGGATGSGTIGNTFNSTIAAYYLELLYLPGAQTSAPTTLTGLDTWSDGGLVGINTASGSGRFGVVGSTTAATVPWAAGTTDNIILVAWSSPVGTNWTQARATLNNGAFPPFAVNSYFGISSSGYIAPRSVDPGSTFVGGGPSIDGSPITSTLTQMYVLPVPEPTTLALAGLGGLSLLLFRRQRK